MWMAPTVYSGSLRVGLTCCLLRRSGGERGCGFRQAVARACCAGAAPSDASARHGDRSLHRAPTWPRSGVHVCWQWPPALCRTAVDEPARRSTAVRASRVRLPRSEEHTSELQSLMRTSYAVFCLKKKIVKENTKLN